MLPCESQRSTTPLSLAADLRLITALIVLYCGLSWDISKHCSAIYKNNYCFTSDYQVTDRSDRMGYRLKGTAIAPSADGILSEGICLGAIQVPADGQPIVLLNDRQTIGGYPKLGSVLSLDISKLAQLLPGATVNFEASV